MTSENNTITINAPSTLSTANPLILSPSRDASSTPLPLPSNNFTSPSFSFILLDKNSNVIQELALSVSPQEYQQVETSTSNVYLTAGDIFSDSYGPGPTMISMSGTFGQRPSGGSGKSLNLVNVGASSSGQYLALQLRDMFRKYLDQLNPIITDDAAANLKTTLQFYNPKDNEFWNIEPVGNWFTLSRSKTSPFLYRYKLSFVCTGRAKSASLFGLGADPLTWLYTNVLGSIIDQYTRGATIATSISSYAAGISSFLNVSGLSAIMWQSNIITPFFNLQTAVGSFLSTSASIINFPLSSIKAIQLNLSTYQQANPSTIPDGSAPNPNYDPYIDNLLVQIQSVLNAYTVNSNYFVKTFIKSDFVNQSTVYDYSIDNIDLTNITSVSYYLIKQGDTLEAIATAFLGDASYWKSIAEYNGLAYPYLSSALPLLDKTLGPGSTLIIPNKSTKSSLYNLILGSSVKNSSNSGVSLGTDFQLNSNNDISFTPVTSGGYDVTTISGVPNFLQAIFLKLHVNRGELAYHPHFGMTNLLGYRTTSLLSAKALSEFHDTLVSDPRTSSVSSETVSVSEDTVNYTAQVNVSLANQPIFIQGSISLS